ncbi:MAG: ABC transporter permease [Bacteroidales bacterium]
MNIELFIAKKIYSNEQGEKRVSLPAIRIAMAGIALGLTVMILAVAIVLGFKQEIRNKVIGFGSHIQIANLDNNSSFESEPILLTDTLYQILNQNSNIRHIESYITKPGIMKTDTEFQGVVFKGTSDAYDWDFIRDHLVEGEIPDFYPDSLGGALSNANEVLISQYISDLMNLNAGDDFLSYFVGETVKLRKFKIKGIYKTNFVDFDKIFVFTNNPTLRKLNDWSDDQVSGVELKVKDYAKLDQTTEDLYYELQDLDSGGSGYYVRSIVDLYPQIFSWLDLLDINVWVILTLMVLVSGFTMVSGLLIIILERTNMIGILKSMGAANVSIRKIFLYICGFLIVRGLMWGNLIAVSICVLQYYFKFLKLDPEMYYLSSVPIAGNLFYLLLINVGTLIVTMLMLIGPSMIISRIVPAKSIRFE